MCSGFRLFISLSLVYQHCVYCNVLRLEDQLYTQVPAQYFFTPRDYQMINELQPPDKNAYVYYYSPVAASRNYDFEEKLPVQLKSQVKRNAAYPSRYLKPPALNAVSSYDRFRSRPMEGSGEEESGVFTQNHRPDTTAQSQKNVEKNQNQGSTYVRDHAPIQQETSDSETTSESKHNVKKKSNKKSSETLELSTDGDRIEFQIQGHEGPKTYIFGYDTGDGKNRQFRLEERLKDGTVKGHYGYYDARGKLRTIRYLAHPMHGYQEKHHESNSISSEEE